jgi:hypothetical protein
MNIDFIVTSIDEQIAKLEQARALLTSANDASVPEDTRASKRRPGRPMKIVQTSSADTKATPKRHVMSDDARARIAAGQKKRWAEAKRAAKTAQ